MRLPAPKKERHIGWIASTTTRVSVPSSDGRKVSAGLTERSFTVHRRELGHGESTTFYHR